MLRASAASLVARRNLVMLRASEADLVAHVCDAALSPSRRREPGQGAGVGGLLGASRVLTGNLKHAFFFSLR